MELRRNTYKVNLEVIELNSIKREMGTPSTYAERQMSSHNRPNKPWNKKTILYQSSEDLKLKMDKHGST